MQSVFNHKVIKCIVFGVPWWSADWNLTEYYSWALVSQGIRPETVKKGWHLLRQVLAWVLSLKYFPLILTTTPWASYQYPYFYTWATRFTVGNTLPNVVVSSESPRLSVLSPTKELRKNRERKHQGSSTRSRDTRGHRTGEAAWGEEVTTAQRDSHPCHKPNGCQLQVSTLTTTQTGRGYWGPWV